MGNIVAIYSRRECFDIVCLASASFHNKPYLCFYTCHAMNISKRDVFSIINLNKCDAHLLSALSTHTFPVQSFLWHCFSHSRCLQSSYDSRLCFLSLIVNIHVDKYHCFSSSLCFCRRLHWQCSLAPSIQWRLIAAANTRLQVGTTVWVMESLLWLQQ